MSKKLGKVLKNVLNENLDEAIVTSVGPLQFDVRNQASMTGAAHKEKRSPAFSDLAPQDMQRVAQEPEDKLLVAIQHLFISGEFEQANALIKEYGCKGVFNWHHMQQLIDWVRNIYKYTNMTDISKNYYNSQMKKEIEGVDNLEKVRIKDQTIDKFVKDAEKVLRKKLAAH